jgi:hypothetical protein
MRKERESMSRRIYYLALVVLSGFFVTQAFTQDELISPTDKGTLLDQHVLAGIERFAVQIVSINNAADIAVPPWNQLNEIVKQQFDKARIDAIIRPISHDPSNTSMLPILEIYIDSLELADEQLCVFHIQTVFKTSVCLEEQPLRHIKADVWKRKPLMEAVSLTTMSSRLTEVVLEQVQAFICAYQSANSPSRLQQLNTQNLYQRQDKVGLYKTSESLSFNQPTKTTFIASKNSKIFHKPECQWAQKIKPENLVIYHSRNQAINAGKRPCKQCQP